MSGGELFVHISACTGGVPKQGDTVTFDLEENGIHNAIEGHAIPHASCAAVCHARKIRALITPYIYYMACATLYITPYNTI